MPYAVAHRPPGIERRKFEAYLRLLEKRGIDWTRAKRIPERGMPHWWLYVWQNRHEADEFCRDLRNETRDASWHVCDVTENDVSSGALTPVVVLMRRHRLGADFSLHPHSEALVGRRFPEARMVTSVSIESDAKEELDQQGSLGEHVVQVLTGLDAESLTELGGFRIVDAANDQTLLEAADVMPCA